MSGIFFQKSIIGTGKDESSYYTYQSYCRLQNKVETHPVSLYFKNNEIVFFFEKKNGEISPLFTIPVTEGEIGQKRITEKIEDYWNAPFFSPVAPGSEKEKILLKVSNLSTSVFSVYYNFDINNEEFIEVNLRKKNEWRLCSIFQKKKDKKKIFSDSNTIVYLTEDKKKVEMQVDGETSKSLLCISSNNSYIETDCINFRLLLMDFIFELEHTDTFSDEKYSQIDSVLKNNKLLRALTKKIEYMHSLKDIYSNNAKIDNEFRAIEKEWVNVCTLESYFEIFSSKNSIFDPSEEELNSLLFQAIVGEKCSNLRNSVFDPGDADLRNRCCSFFFRQYNLWLAFKTMHPVCVRPVFSIFLLGSMLGVFAFSIELEWSFVLNIFPIAFVGFITGYFCFTKINLFKLFLPRLFLGIMVGWSLLWSTEELWERALISTSKDIVLIFIFLFAVLLLYIFTEVNNKLSVRIKYCYKLYRSLTVLLIAMIISLIQGYYLIQFFAPQVLENSGIINEIALDTLNKKKHKDIAVDNNQNKRFDMYSTLRGVPAEKEWDIGFKQKILGLDNYKQSNEKVFLLNRYNIRILSILLSQFMMSIFIGIVLQLLWEDRPITEPL